MTLTNNTNMKITRKYQHNIDNNNDININMTLTNNINMKIT